MKLFDQKVHFKSAPEPSNIIWENLEVTRPTMKKRECIAGFGITLFIIICFLSITAMKAYSGTTKQKYPISVNCEDVSNTFRTKYPCDGDCLYKKSKNDSLGFSLDAFESYRDYAKHDRDYSLQVDPLDPDTSGQKYFYLTSGAYQCFCQDLNFLEGSKDLCKEYSDEKNKSTLLSTLVSVMITVVNTLVRTINMKLVDYIG